MSLSKKVERFLLETCFYKFWEKSSWLVFYPFDFNSKNDIRLETVAIGRILASLETPSFSNKLQHLSVDG